MESLQAMGKGFMNASKNDILHTIDEAEKYLTDDQMFRECVCEILTDLQIEDIELANELAVSRSTVARWKNGRSVPYPAMRRPVYAALRRKVHELRKD